VGVSDNAPCGRPVWWRAVACSRRAFAPRVGAVGSRCKRPVAGCGCCLTSWCGGCLPSLRALGPTFKRLHF